MQDPVLVIGASGTLGGAVASALVAQGHRVLLHGRRDTDALRAQASALNAAIVTGDLSDEAAVEELVTTVQGQGGLSGIVFAAARPFPHKMAWNTDWSVYQEQMDSQLKALHLTVTALKPILKGREDGARIVVLSTEYVLGAPPTKIAPYIAAKAALTAYCRVLAQEVLKAGIRVHIAAPGMVRSALTADLPDAYLDDVAAAMPEGKLTHAQDVADLCVHLMSPAADPLYGTVLPVSRAQRR